MCWGFTFASSPQCRLSVGGAVFWRQNSGHYSSAGFVQVVRGQVVEVIPTVCLRNAGLLAGIAGRKVKVLTIPRGCGGMWLQMTCIIRSLKLMRYKENFTHEPPHDKTNKTACAPSEDSDQPGHLPSLIRVFAVRSMGS